MRPFVRKDSSRLVWLCRDRHDEAAAFALDAVRVDEILDREPGRRLVVVLEDSLGEPRAVEISRLFGRFGKRDVDDVVGAARVERRALVVVDRVVRGSDEVGRRPSRAGVADGAKRLDVGHRGRAYQRVRAI